jgi:hypothetical protein
MLNFECALLKQMIDENKVHNFMMTEASQFSIGPTFTSFASPAQDRLESLT